MSQPCRSHDVDVAFTTIRTDSAGVTVPVFPVRSPAGATTNARPATCTPGHLEEMHRRIAGSRLVISEDASHLCFAEQPEQFNEVINSFLA
jgi:pimeloyl-ACP methyl ester carboxylesterase